MWAGQPASRSGWGRLTYKSNHDSSQFISQGGTDPGGGCQRWPRPCRSLSEGDGTLGAFRVGKGTFVTAGALRDRTAPGLTAGALRVGAAPSAGRDGVDFDVAMSCPVRSGEAVGTASPRLLRQPQVDASADSRSRC